MNDLQIIATVYTATIISNIRGDNKFFIVLDGSRASCAFIIYTLALGQMSEADVLIATEYDALRKEIDRQLTQIHNLELGALGAVGTVWTWLFTHPSAPRVAWLVPVALVVLGLIKAYSLFRSVKLIGGFIREREAAIFPAGENNLEANNTRRWETYRNSKSAGLVKSAVIFWLSLLGCTAPNNQWSDSRLAAPPRLIVAAIAQVLLQNSSLSNRN